MDALDRCFKSRSEDANLEGQLARILDRQSRVLNDMGDASGARALLDRSAGMSRHALQKARAGDIKIRETLSETLWDTAQLLHHPGQVSDTQERSKCAWHYGAGDLRRSSLISRSSKLCPPM